MSKMNMANQFNLINKMQKEMEKVQEALDGMTVEGSAGGGMVTVVANGKQKIVSVSVDPEVVSGDDIEMLEDLIIAAVNQALDKSRDMAQEEMQNVAGGLLGNIPGGLKIPGLTM